MKPRATADPWPTTATSDPFDRAQRQLLAEERALRALAEGQVREFRRLVVEFASAFVAEELDSRRRADPRFAERATPVDWRQLLRSARQTLIAAAEATARYASGGVPRQTAVDAVNAALERIRVLTPMNGAESNRGPLADDSNLGSVRPGATPTPG